MDGSILYMGDTALSGAAAYLAGLMSSWGWRFDYVPSDEPLADHLPSVEPALYVFSDYPAARVDEATQRQIADRVARGAGLLMIGGWESFHGLGGAWDGTALSEALPVQIAAEDDRLNCDHPVFVRRVTGHPIAGDLPFGERPPLIGGLNRVQARPGTTTILEARRFSARWAADTVQLTRAQTHPLLVAGVHGHGRTAALMTDLAPHWVGPFIDWGDERVTAKSPQSFEVEVGNLYAQFVRQLLEWTAGG
jgi:hypothetical protein